MGGVIRLPEPCLVVLVGPAGCGKSTWAARSFRPHQIISSDRLRSMVGTGERDQRAGTAAFEVLDLVVDHRLRRRLTTVIDSTALEAGRRRTYLDMARARGVPVIAAVFAVPDSEVRRRNRQRSDPVPSAVLTAQLRSLPASLAAIPTEGFDAVVAAHDHDVVVVPPQLVDAPSAARRQQEDPMPLEFGLQVPRFTWPGGSAEIATTLAAIAGEAEQAGFTSIWVMDHYLQIPQVGREWDEMLEAYTTLGYLAGQTTTARLGTLCTGITYRNVAALGKIVATLDVLSGGRAMAGLGLGWFQREHDLYGWDFPRARGATSCSKTPSNCCRCCGARDRRGSRAGRSPCPRRSAIHVRCRTTFRSSSADPANDGRCDSSPATPTPATCSATRPRCATRSRCSTGTVPTSTATRPRSR